MQHQHLTGTWRAYGLDGLDPGTAHSLTLVQRRGRVVGGDTAHRGITRGVVRTGCPGGCLRAAGSYRREDGTLGRFLWSLSPDGGRLAGVMQDAGRAARPFHAVRQSASVPRGQAAFMDRRIWDGGSGLSGIDVRMCEVKVGGIVVGRAPCGVDMEGPGGSKIGVGKEGVKIKEPSIEDLIGGGGGGGKKAKPDPKSDPKDTEAAKASERTSRIILWVAGGALAAGVAALVLRRKKV